MMDDIFWFMTLMICKDFNNIMNRKPSSTQVSVPVISNVTNEKNIINIFLKTSA